MASVDDCLREASDCVRHAEECSEQSEQAVFMLLAKSWMRLAVQIDEVRSSPSIAMTEQDGSAEADEVSEPGHEDTSRDAAGAESLPTISSPDTGHR